jgi:hypothetical protein
MNQIPLDDSLRSHLGDFQRPVEIADSGRVVGFFVPKSDFYAMLQSPNSEDEINRRIEHGGGRTLKEIWADFEKR